MHGVAQQDTIELSDLSGICFYNRRRDSSTSGIGQRWYRCTERDLGAHVHMHMGMCAALVTIIIIGTSGMVVIIIGARRVIAPGISIDSMRAVTLMVMYRFALTLIN